MTYKITSALVGVVLSFGLVALTNFQTVAAEDAPGNNGTIKVDRLDFDSAPDNQPKVGCTFQVDFYNYGEGVGNASVSFDLQAPTVEGRTLTVTSGDLTPDIGEDAPGGGTDVDAQETYTLAFTGEPAAQGYHVKLTINAPNSNGNDVKHKVFYVSGCEPEEEEGIPGFAVSLVCPVDKYNLTITNTGETELDVEVNGSPSKLTQTSSTTGQFNVGDTLSVKVNGEFVNVQGKLLNNFKLVTCQGMGSEVTTNNTTNTTTNTTNTATNVVASSGFGAGATTDVASLPVTSGNSAQAAGLIMTISTILAGAGAYLSRSRSGLSI